MNKRLAAILVLVALTAAVAQTAVERPFFGSVPTPYDAVIAVVPSPTGYNPPKKGVAQAPLISPFGFEIPAGGGFVGATPPGAAPTILDKPGMTFIAPITP